MAEEFDADGFSYSQTNFGDSIGYYEQQLKKDFRKDNFKGDVIARYNNFNEWRKTPLAKDVDRAIDLIPSGSEISVRNLRAAMTYNFVMSKDYANKVIKELGSNDKRIKARNHTLDRSIDEIRLKKIK